MEILSQWRQPLPSEITRWYRSFSAANLVTQDNLADDFSALLPQGLEDMAEVLLRRKRYIEEQISRETLCRQLTRSHQARHAPTAVLRNIERLQEPDTFLVVTGQQPGLLGGPLFTIYKIIQTIHLSRQLTQSQEGRFLPAFWNAAEDHDLSEISVFHWFSKDNQLERFTWDLDESSQPYFAVDAARLPLDAMRSFIQTHSHPTEFLEPQINALEEMAEEAASYPDFFDRLMWRWFGDEGLIVLRPDDPYTREAAVPYLKAEIQQPQKAAEEINLMGEKLSALGLPVQIHKREDRTSFFLIEHHQRIPLYFSDNGFSGKDGTRHFPDELLQRLETRPDVFSPSAVLRPVIQDAVYPTVAAVLGPHETAYHALLHPVYDRHGVVRPCVVPRSGFTLLEPRMMKWIRQYDLHPQRLQEHPAAVAKKIIKQLQPDHDELPTQPLKDTVDTFFDAALRRARAVDPSLIQALEKNKTRIEKEIENSENVIIRREAAQHETLLHHLQTLQTFVYPDGEKQERCLNLFYFLVKYGEGFVKDLAAITRDVTPGSHAFIQIP